MNFKTVKKHLLKIIANLNKAIILIILSIFLVMTSGTHAVRADTVGSNYSRLQTITYKSKSFNLGDSQSMTIEEIQSTIKQAANAWMKGDATGFASLFISEGEFIVPGNKWQGREAIQTVVSDFYKSYFDVKIDIKRILIDGDRAVVEWHWENTEKDSGKISKAEDAIVVDFQNGGIQRWREYIDDKSPNQ